jgi:hypothetical protein
MADIITCLHWTRLKNGQPHVYCDVLRVLPFCIINIECHSCMPPSQKRVPRTWQKGVPKSQAEGDAQAEAGVQSQAEGGAQGQADCVRCVIVFIRLHTAIDCFVFALKLYLR